MSDEKTYKYVILRSRDGEYLIPYSGIHGLADVAFTGKYSDLIDTPDEGVSYLPATKDPSGDNKYDVSAQVVMTDKELILDYDLDYLVNRGTDFEDLVGDANAVHSQYVSDVANYLVDSLQEQINIAITECSKEAEKEIGPYDHITKVFKGFVTNYNDLLSNEILSTVQEGDVYFVEQAGYNTWFMYVTGAGTNWVEVTL